MIYKIFPVHQQTSLTFQISGYHVIVCIVQLSNFHIILLAFEQLATIQVKQVYLAPYTQVAMYSELIQQ